MPAERVSMRRIREILRLKYEGGATERAIARSIGVARSTVALTLERIAAAQLGWPLPPALSDAVLEAMLYASAGRPQGLRRKRDDQSGGHELSQVKGRGGIGVRLSTAISTRCPPQAGQISSGRPKRRAKRSR
jgi:hypothetical protein